MNRTLAVVIVLALGQSACSPRILAAAAFGLIAGATVASLANDIARDKRHVHEGRAQRITAERCRGGGGCRTVTLIEICDEEDNCEYVDAPESISRDYEAYPSDPMR